MQKNPKEIWIGDKCYKKNKKLKKQIQSLLGNQTAFHEKLDIIGEVFDNVLQLEDIVDRETWEFLDLPVPEAIAENIVGDYLVHRIFLD